MSKLDSIVHRYPEVLSGELVFVGTRVPVRSLFDYMAAGVSLEVFLDYFPTVSRDQAISALKEANKLLVSHLAAD